MDNMKKYTELLSIGQSLIKDTGLYQDLEKEALWLLHEVASTNGLEDKDVEGFEKTAVMVNEAYTSDDDKKKFEIMGQITVGEMRRYSYFVQVMKNHLKRRPVRRIA